MTNKRLVLAVLSVIVMGAGCVSEGTRVCGVARNVIVIPSIGNDDATWTNVYDNGTFDRGTSSVNMAPGEGQKVCKYVY